MAPPVGLLVGCPGVLRRDASFIVGVPEAGVSVAVAGAGVGMRRGLMRRFAARARISFMRSIVYAPFPSVSQRRRMALM